mmetsp:Transcript_2969/g.8347  ORF Transcript_2969/g.8347 Transcript_2969/m.8347 type:complete len:284 (-) Transcript_2969:439-1290(-)
MLRQDGAVDCEEPRVGVHRAARLARLHPLVPVQDLGVQPSVHALARPPSRERATASQEHLQHRHGCQERPVPAALHLPAQHEVAQRVWLLHGEIPARVHGLRHLADRGWRRRSRGSNTVLCKTAGRPLAQLVEVDVHPHDDELVWRALALEVTVDRLRGEAGQVLLVGVELVAEGVPLVRRQVEQLADEAFDVGLEVLPDLRDVLVRSRHLLREDRRAQHVGQHERQRYGDVLPQHVELVQDVLAPHTAGGGRAELLQRLHRAYVAQVRGGPERHQLEGVGQE